jgi:putative lipoprotein
MRMFMMLSSTLVVLAGCGGNKQAQTGEHPSGAKMAKVTGTVFYLERIALPPGAVLKVQLADVSRADAPAEVIAADSIIVTHQVPIPFSLSYDANRIVPSHTYAVQARIEVDGKLRFINTSSNPVVTNGKPASVDVRVSPVPQ